VQYIVAPIERSSSSIRWGWGFQKTAWWLDQPTIVDLPAGYHTIRIQVREDGVRLDDIILIPSGYTPGWPKDSRMFY